MTVHRMGVTALISSVEVKGRLFVKKIRVFDPNFTLNNRLLVGIQEYDIM